MSKTKQIVENRKARHEFSLGEAFEAGLCLEGWEVKSLREGKVQLVDSYVQISKNEAFMIGALITPLDTTDTFKKAFDRRDRKLLMHRREIDNLRSMVDTKGKTLVCTKLYWSNGKVKAEVRVATGKQMHDKRASDKDKSMKREAARAVGRG